MGLIERGECEKCHRTRPHEPGVTPCLDCRGLTHERGRRRPKVAIVSKERSLTDAYGDGYSQGFEEGVQEAREQVWRVLGIMPFIDRLAHVEAKLRSLEERVDEDAEAVTRDTWVIEDELEEMDR